jgi:hypothetical protein
MKNATFTPAEQAPAKKAPAPVEAPVSDATKAAETQPKE